MIRIDHQGDCKSMQIVVTLNNNYLILSVNLSVTCQFYL